MAWSAGVLTGSLATCPNMALRPLVIRSDTGARPVGKETSELGPDHATSGFDDGYLPPSPELSRGQRHVL